MHDFQWLLQRIRPLAEQLISEITSIEFAQKDKLVNEIKVLLTNVNETYFHPTISFPDSR